MAVLVPEVNPLSITPIITKTKPYIPTHPPTAVMVIAAITELKEKKGSSLSAIKKYLSTNYKVDTTRLAPFIRKFLKASVVKGSLVQTNGIGAMGHFKLPAEVKKKAVAKKPAAKKAVKKPTKASSSAVTPKKRKLTAKKAAATTAEPKAKKPKTVAVKPKKSLVKSRKIIAAPKPPKVKKAVVVKQTKTPKKK